MADTEHRLLLWAAVATGGLAAATGVYWAAKRALDIYVPYQVRVAALPACSID